VTVPTFVARAAGSAPVGGARAVLGAAELAALGPLARGLEEEAVSDLLLNPDGSVWRDRGAGLERLPAPAVAPDLARRLAVGLVALGGRHVDEATPCADVRLGSGARVHVVLPPVSPGGATISVRLPRPRPPTLADLEADGFFARVPLGQVLPLVARRANLLVTGPSGAGKTTLLGALLAAAPDDERILVIEDVAELRIAHPHVVALQARQPNLEGAGGIGLDRLLREALRMRPDRLVVGECRGAEVRELLSALNTGHDGGAGTLHANSLEDVPARLEALGALAGLDADALARQAVSALDAVLHVERGAEGRRLAALGALELDGAGRLRVRPG